MLDGVDAAPDGEHILVTSIHKPYSYVTTFDRFPHDVEVWDRAGPRSRARRVAAARRSRARSHGVPTGPRDFEWRPTEPATLVWAEALDGGDWNVKVPARDKVMIAGRRSPAPPTEITRTEQRFAGFELGRAAGLALLRELRREPALDAHLRRSNVDEPRAKPRLALGSARPTSTTRTPATRCIASCRTARGSCAGRRRDLPLRRRARRPTAIARSSIASTSRPQQGRAPLPQRQDGVRALPRVHRPDTTELPHVAPVADRSAERVPPHARRARVAARRRRAGVRVDGAPDHAHPGSDARGARDQEAPREVQAQGRQSTSRSRSTRRPTTRRARACRRSSTRTRSTTPTRRRPGRSPAREQTFTRLRAVPAAAARRATRSSTTRRSRSSAIRRRPTTPTSSSSSPTRRRPSTRPWSSASSIRDRIGVTGHSHGALMTANLLAHSDLFRAGVATSGSYNKTLTPFGFQNERRSVWEAPERLPQGVAVLLRRQDEAAAPHHARRRTTRTPARRRSRRRSSTRRSAATAARRAS